MAAERSVAEHWRLRKQKEMGDYWTYYNQWTYFIIGLFWCTLYKKTGNQTNWRRLYNVPSVRAMTVNSKVGLPGSTGGSCVEAQNKLFLLGNTRQHRQIYLKRISSLLSSSNGLGTLFNTCNVIRNHATLTRLEYTKTSLIRSSTKLG